jgi:hypothetical protein
MKSLLPAMFLSACATTTAVTDTQLEEQQKRAHQEWIERRQAECESAHGVCPPELLPDLPLVLLRGKGSAIKIDCDLDFIDHSEESAREECRKNVLAAMSALVEQWREDLVPTDPNQLTFELEDGGCISMITGVCVCPFYGYANVPLIWKAPELSR